MREPEQKPVHPQDPSRRATARATPRNRCPRTLRVTSGLPPPPWMIYEKSRARTESERAKGEVEIGRTPPQVGLNGSG